MKQSKSMNMNNSLITLKYLVVAMASLAAMQIAQADTKVGTNAIRKIGDLEVYKAAEGGNINVTMMLDTSGSMSIDAVGSNACIGLPSNASNVSTSYEDSGTSPSYRKNYCSYNNKKYYDKLTQLKDALFALMDSPAILAKADKTKIGIGQFSSQSNSNNNAVSADGTSGKIVVPAAILDTAQRDRIKTAVANFVGYNGTPTAHAYAEAAAYLLGTNTTPTGVASNKQNYFVGNNNQYIECRGWNGTSCSNWHGWYNGSPDLSESVLIGNTQLYGVNGKLYTGPDPTVAGASGFKKSYKDSKNGANYISPITSNSTCDGNGIYFLTDGSPNTTPNPSIVMKPALGATYGADFAVPATGALPPGSDTAGSGMPEISEFAKRLRDASKNPSKSSIRTAVVGFGSDFDLSIYPNITKTLPKPKLDPNTNLPLLDGSNQPIYQEPKNGVIPTGTYYDCTKIPTTSIDARNACQWGAKSHPSLPNVGGYGEGGFTSAQKAQDVIDSVVNFVSDLDNSIPSAPSGTIIIPDDPYKVDSQLAVAYYPTLQAQVDKNPATWGGNMKKYNLDQGTLWGKHTTRLFLDVSGKLNPNAEDLWSAQNNAGANNQATSGGYISQLNAPVTNNLTNIRTVYVEDSPIAGNNTPVLKAFGVNASGKVTVDGAPLSNTSFNDTTTYTDTRLRILLKFLGFSGFNETTAVSALTLTAPTAAVKIVGATYHSTPAAVSYSATLDTNGRVTAARDDYMLFGSSDGALHMVNANDSTVTNGGKEKFAIIPKLMLLNQPEALMGTISPKGIGQPYFGVDAPWLVATDYRYNYAASGGTVGVDTRNGRGSFAYGGLRMGGEALYGLDLTTANTGKPTMLFSITPNSTGFTRLGQIWAKPTKAKIKTNTSVTGETDVLIFGGGYDTCYENEGFQVGITDATFATDVKGQTCSNKTAAQGNAVYIINAKTGALIWSASSSGGNKTVPEMKNSIVGAITTLDRNNDGFIDHLYFGDLGGQVFRADFSNAGSNGSSSFTNTRVVRVLKNTYEGIADKAKYANRFYERPIISFYTNPLNQRLFALVNIISGDRSSPLSRMRNDNTYADRVYGLIDSDITLPDDTFYDATKFAATSTVANLDEATSLLALQPATGSGITYDAAKKKGVIATLQKGDKKGWYYPLNRFDGYVNVKFSKGWGKSEVIDSKLYTTVYNPDMLYGKTDSCAAKITGGSERELYCLPYGICYKEGVDSNGQPVDLYAASTNGTAGFLRAGQGTQELTLGPLSAKDSTKRVLIGTRTLAEQVSDIRVNFGNDPSKHLGTGSGNTGTNAGGDIAGSGLDGNAQAGAAGGAGNGGSDSLSTGTGDGTSSPGIQSIKYSFIPTTWYEVN